MKRILPFMILLWGLNLPAHALEPDAPIVLAQSSNTDYRVSVLEEQVRQLNGKIEELNFQLLEMQELIRRMQEDNDFRFQQLEEKQGNFDSGNSETAQSDEDGFIRLEKPEPSDQQAVAAGSDGISESNRTKRTIEGVELFDGEQKVEENLSQSLGTLQFDENGNVIDSTLGKPLDLTAGLGDSNSPQENALPQDPESLFQLGYDQVQTGRYEDAEKALVAFSEQYASHPRLPEVRFWLGESYLGRGQYRKAAETYLNAQKQWPNSKFGPQSLLKLGVSVAGLNQRELACATFAEVLQKYPDASRAIKRNVAYEQRAAKCTIN
ncbi:MAG: tol-pal system protein YbgF [Pseudomonadota bacterium]